MPINKGTPYNNDDGLTEELLDQVGAIWRQIIQAPSTTGQPVAESQWSTGRDCPKCAGHLKFFEYREKTDTVILQCGTCRKIWHEPDLDAHDIHNQVEGLVDNINFREVPEDTVRLWMEAREQEKIRAGEWLPEATEEAPE
jgi:ssDNA-binding Zn-finger/Zn-ribbon topoisomerase 1